MFSSRLQNMKQSAYLDYFKSFSVNANDTLKKLQQQFKQEIQDSLMFDNNSALKKIKTLLGSYQLLIFQINDSCEFVQIPQFGLCLVKIFLQVMSVIKFLLMKLLEKQQNQRRHSNSGTQLNQSHYHNFNSSQPSLKFQRLSSPSFKKKTSLIHHNNNNSGQSLSILENKTYKNPQSFNSQVNQKEIYKHKEQSKFMIHTLNQQLNLLEMEQWENQQVSKKQLRALIEGKQKLQAIQTSKNQSILTETLNSFCKKGEHLKNFVSVRQTAMMNNMKESSGNDAILKVRDILDEDSTTKMNHASTKLQSLFKNHVLNYVRQKQSQMLSYQCQVNIDDTIEQLKSQQNKNMKKLSDIIKKLQDEIQMQKQKNKSIEKLLKQKSQQFEMKTMEFRVAKIQMDNLKIKLQKQKEKQLQKELSKFANATMPLQQSQKQIQYCQRCRQKILSLTSNKSNRITLTQSVSKGLIDVDQMSEMQQNQRNQSTQQQVSNNDEAESQEDAQLVENHSRLMQKINRSRVHYQSMSTNNVNKKNIVSQFIYDSLQKKTQLLQICSKQWQETIKPNKIEKPVRMINITGGNNGGKKKTVFAGRSFQTNPTQDVNNATVQSIRSNTGNEKRKKTKFLQQKKSIFNIEKVIQFSFIGIKKKQDNKPKKQQKSNKLIQIKKYLKKLSQQSNENNNQSKELQQFAQKIYYEYQQSIADSKSSNRQYPTETNLSSIFMRQKSEPSDQQSIQPYFGKDNKNNQEMRNDPIYRMTAYNNRGKTAEKFDKVKKESVMIKNNQLQNNLFRNSTKPPQIEKEYELARVQSQNLLAKPSFGTKNNLQIHQSLTKFPQVSEIIEQNRLSSCLKNNTNKNLNNIKINNLQVMNTVTFLCKNDKYPKLIKFSSQQKVILTMKDLNNLFIDINTAKNFEYINLFQNDEVKITNTIKIKKNNSLNPTQQHLKKKNIANGLIKKTMEEQQEKKKEKGMITEQFHKIGIHVAVTPAEEISKKERISTSAQKRQSNLHFQQLINKSQNNFYTLQFITSTLFRHLRQVKKISYSQSSLSQYMTVYETIRNFLRYPYSAVTLINDKQFIQKQRHESAIEYLQLRKILQRIFKLHQHCDEYKYDFCVEKNVIFERIDMKDKEKNDNASKEKENIKEQHQILCKHSVQFFEKIGILFFPSRSFIQINKSNP